MKKNNYIAGEQLDKHDYEELTVFARVGYFCLEPNGDIHCINRIAYDFLNHDDTTLAFEKLPGTNIVDLHGEFLVLLKLAENDSNIEEYEMRLTWDDYTELWISINCRQVDHQGKVLLEISFHDISKLKKVQHAFEVSQQKLDSILDTIPDVIYQLDNNGNFTFISDAIRDYGYDPDTLIGESILTIIHPDDREKALYRANERRTGSRKTISFELRIVTGNHSVKNVEFRNTTIENVLFVSISAEGYYTVENDSNKKFIGTLGIARDISRMVVAERVKFEAEKKYYETLQSLQEGYYEMDSQGIVFFINRAFGQILGIDADLPEAVNFFDMIKKSDREKVREVFLDVKKNNIPVSFNDILFDYNGRERVVNGSITPLLYGEDGVSRYGGIVLDKTSQVKIEKDLFQARKLEAVGLLAGGIAHDYNNALTAIIGNISLAKMISENTPSDILEILDDAEAGAQKIKELTTRLSTFAKGGRPDKRVIHLDSFIRETVPAVLDFFQGSYSLTVDDDLWMSEVDPAQMSYVIEHILNNAVEATENRGVITIDVRNVDVDKALSHHEISLQKGKYILMEFRDNGPGIAEENLYNIFDPYYTTKDVASGMGLAIAYAIVKRHRGYIDVASDESGADFFVYLPAYAQ